MIEPTDTGIILSVKAVPNASRDRIVGPLGDCLKIKVAAPPEAGKANAAICKLLATAFSIPLRNVELIRGTAQPLKRFAINGVTSHQAQAILAPS